jgi:hypothetical protein
LNFNTIQKWVLQQGNSTNDPQENFPKVPTETEQRYHHILLLNCLDIQENPFVYIPSSWKEILMKKLCRVIFILICKSNDRDRRSKGLNDPIRSGDVILIMEYKTTDTATNRYTTA